MMNNDIKVGDFVRFINADFIIGVVTKISPNGTITIMDENGGMELYTKSILKKYPGDLTSVTAKDEVNSLLDRIKAIKIFN